MFSAVLQLLDSFDAHRHEPPSGGRPFPPAGRMLAMALIVARTPDVALPPSPEAPAPTRAEAEAASGA